MMARPMPFSAVPCAIWLPHIGTPDVYGNARPTYNEQPDIETMCCYAPGRSSPMTSDDIEEDRPHGDEERMLFFLPKGLYADLRGARIAAMPPDDPYVASVRYAVEGEPRSYPRMNTPGDYSWCVTGVRVLG